MSAPKTNLQPDEYSDVISDLSGGMDSGVETLSLPKNKINFGLNTTVRGRYITHRPPYQQQNLILDVGLNLGLGGFQGACYYKPDYGQESIISQIGGRLYQFIPDSTNNIYVYDRTAKKYSGSNNYTIYQSQSSPAQYTVVLLNVNDVEGTVHNAATGIISDPAFFGVTSASAVITSVNNGTAPNQTVTWSGTITLPANFPIPANIAGTRITIAYTSTGTTYPNASTFQWLVGTPSGQSLPISFTDSYYTSGGGGFTIPAGTAVSLLTNPSPPSLVDTTNQSFTAPAIGSIVIVSVVAQFPLALGAGVEIGGMLYYVQSIPAPIQNPNFITPTSAGTIQSSVIGTDPNPAGVRQVWLCQAENYMIVQDGQSRPVIFDGTSSRRSATPTFIGTITSPFVVPAIGKTVNISLNAPYLDSVGTFITVSALNYFPFFMQVVATYVGGNPNIVTVQNITGQSVTGISIPVSTNINSTLSASWYGVLTAAVTMGGIASSNTIQVTPQFTGSIGDTLVLTDGSGQLTSYSVTVTAISSGGSILTVTNQNATAGTIIQLGYPIYDASFKASELPVGKMMAYVQGRVWIALPNGKAFVAGDQADSSSGTAQFNFRDAVLKWSQNTAQFPIPGDSGVINCMTKLAALDASMGQGPLQVLCDNNVFTCSAPTDATQWASVTNPILTESIIGTGGVGQNAAVINNSDLVFRSTDGNIYSLKIARQDFNQWGTLPISEEVNRVINQENRNLLGYCSHVNCDNRILMSCAPITTQYGTYAQGVIALDTDVTSSLQGKLPSVYDGVWTGLNVLQLVTGKFNKVNRTFAFVQNPNGNVEVWEQLTSGYFDNPIATPSQTANQPIDWVFETPLFMANIQGKPIFGLCRLRDLAMWISNIVGKVTITVRYQSDFDNCWHLYNTICFCADNLTNGQPPQYRPRYGFGLPVRDEYDPTTGKRPDTGRFFQLRVEVNGHCKIMGIELDAVEQNEPQLAQVKAQSL